MWCISKEDRGWTFDTRAETCCSSLVKTVSLGFATVFAHLHLYSGCDWSAGAASLWLVTEGQAVTWCRCEQVPTTDWNGKHQESMALNLTIWGRILLKKGFSHSELSPIVSWTLLLYTTARKWPGCTKKSVSHWVFIDSSSEKNIMALTCGPVEHKHSTESDHSVL